MAVRNGYENRHSKIMNRRYMVHTNVPSLSELFRSSSKLITSSRKWDASRRRYSRELCPERCAPMLPDQTLNLASSLFVFGKGWAEESRLCSDKVEGRAWKDCRRLVTLSAIDAITLGARK